MTRWTYETRRRLGLAAGVAVVLGVLLHSVLAYGVLQAGGLTVTSVRSSCAEAATGEARASYRTAEDVEVVRRFLPPAASCRWSAGSTAELFAPSLLGWVGPVLVVAGGLGLLVLRLPVQRGERAAS